MDAAPGGRTVVHFRFPDVRGVTGRWWLVIEPKGVDLCDDDPGHAVDVTVTTSLRVLTDVWRGQRTWARAIGAGELSLDGPERLRRALPGWFTRSPFAEVPRAEPVVRVPSPAMS